MKTFYALLLSLLSQLAFAQGYGDKVQVYLNKTALVKKYETGGAAVTAAVAPKMLGKINIIKIMQSGFAEAGWKRIYSLTDSGGAEVKYFEKNGAAGTCSWKIINLPALLKKYGSLQLHTTTLPTDPAKAALVRVARYHVCTLVYKP